MNLLKNKSTLPIIVILLIAIVGSSFIQDRDTKLLLWGALSGSGLVLLYFALSKVRK